MSPETNLNNRNQGYPPLSLSAKDDLASEIDSLRGQIAARDMELVRLKERRDAEVRELNEVKVQLEEAKSILEIKVTAKTKELRELADTLEKQVDDRTRELRAKIEESESSRVALMNMLEDMEDLRRRAEAEKEKTLAIITNFSDGLIFFDSLDYFSLANPQIENYFSATKDDIRRCIGKKISEMSKVAAFKPLTDLMGQALRQISRKELFLSETKFFEISSLEVRSRQEKIGTLVIVHDVSREKAIERMKTEFVSIAAHQLRTPISAIKWTLRMILDGDLGPINDEQRDFLEKTYKSNERMINLINDLLNVTRIEEGRHIYNLGMENFGVVIEGLVGNYADILKQKNLNLHFAKPGQALPQVKIDPEKMRLAIANFIENAIKYTPAGGDIFMEVLVRGDEIQTSVRDTGIGIIKDQQSRIFTKYFRGSNALKTETEGTGLGLFIAKNIIETHGGKVWFASEEGKGTTFYFTVPVAK
ncbi:MAG: ATP-binding protein [Candidatus Pacebacteria bacterium]|jgi:signal transduction histidine kinase|nr:ATP-binding protein [Candidatus Paceibacterota bacterium]